MESEAFSALAGHFEELNEGCDYEKWSQYLQETLATEGAGKKGVDIGCGEGYFSRALTKAGFSMTGLDVSEPMIECAKKKAKGEALDIEYALADIAGPPAFEDEFDFAICANDCLNYVRPKKIGRALGNIAKMLKSGGVLIFDVTSSEGLDLECGDFSFEDRENVTAYWESDIEDRDGEAALVTEITLFERKESGLYEKKSEEQVRYFHGEDRLLSSLRRAGFEARKDMPDFCGDDFRIFYIARKTGKS